MAGPFAGVPPVAPSTAVHDPHGGSGLGARAPGGAAPTAGEVGASGATFCRGQATAAPEDPATCAVAPVPAAGTGGSGPGARWAGGPERTAVPDPAEAAPSGTGPMPM